MYNAQDTISRIQSVIKEKGLTQKTVFLECGISENTVKRMTDNKGISSFYLARIADYLECSVDYLLGRTDNPEISSESYINGDNSVQAIKNGIVNIDTKNCDSDVTELVKLIQGLPLVKRAEAIIYISNLAKDS